MTTPCQRWRDRRGSYRPAGEPIDPSRYEVVALDDDARARAFVERHHYSGSLPAAVVRADHVHRSGHGIDQVIVISVRERFGLVQERPVPFAPDQRHVAGLGCRA